MAASKGSSGISPPTVVRTKALLTSAAFDCEVAFFNWQTAWSRKRREWCCKHFDRGCKTLPLQGANSSVNGSWHYDCEAGSARFHEGRSDAKKAWCCQHHKKGCPQSAVAHASGPRAQQQQQ